MDAATHPHIVGDDLTKKVTPMPTKYGKVCRRDVTKIRDTLRKNMRTWAKEWAESGLAGRGKGHSGYEAFLKEKLTAAIKSIPVTCT